MFYILVRLLLVVILKPVFRYKITGAQNLPHTGPVIIAANHRSYLDAIMVSIAVKNPKINFMAKGSLFRYPVFGTMIRMLNAFPVQIGIADKAAIVRSLKVLASGEMLVIFPEGTRYRLGGMGPAYPGVTSIALKTGATIVPVGISGTDKIMPPGVKILRFPKINVNIGKPILVEKTRGADRKGLEDKLTQQVMQAITELI